MTTNSLAMKLKVLRWIALATGSLVNIWLAKFAFLIGAYFFGDLFDGDGQPFELNTLDIILLFSMLLSIASIIIAWFHRKIGGLPVTLFAVILIMANAHEVILRAEWPFYVLLFSGILLLFDGYANSWLSKAQEI